MFSPEFEPNYIGKTQLFDVEEEPIPVEVKEFEIPTEEESREIYKKKWIFSIPEKDSNYGPYDSIEVCEFLHKLKLQESQKNEFFVIDNENDVYFEPNSLQEKLEEVLGKFNLIDLSKPQKEDKSKLFVPKKSVFNLEERKIVENTKLITKFDVAILNSKKAKGENYIPMSQLKLQLRDIRRANEMKKAISKTTMNKEAPAKGIQFDSFNPSALYTPQNNRNQTTRPNKAVNVSLEKMFL